MDGEDEIAEIERDLFSKLKRVRGIGLFMVED